MPNKINPKFIIALAAFLAVAVIASACYIIADAVRVADQERKRQLSEPLEIEYRQLERELENFEFTVADPLPCGSTMTIVTLDLDESVYSTLFRIMCESGEDDYLEANGRQMFVGTICLSPEEMPGGKDKVRLDQFREMISAGWEIAIFVDADRALRLDSYLSEMAVLIEDLKMDFPDTVYFADASYRISYDGVLDSYGINSVIHTNAEGFDLVGTDLESDMWRVGAVGWSGTRANSSLDAFNSLLISKGGLVFALETWYGDREASTHFVPGESDSSVKNMLGVFGTSVLDGELHIGSAIEGRENYSKYDDARGEAEDGYVPMRQAIIDRMAEIKAELERINNS